MIIICIFANLQPINNINVTEKSDTKWDEENNDFNAIHEWRGTKHTLIHSINILVM